MEGTDILVSVMSLLHTLWYEAPPRYLGRFLGGMGVLPMAEPTLYLTFDDGPTAETDALLDVLHTHEVPATFFLLGKAAISYPTQARYLGSHPVHRIGNHGMFHRDAWRLNRADAEQDMWDGHEVLSTFSDAPITWWRPPYGHLRPCHRPLAEAAGARIALWARMPGDFLHLEPLELAQRLLNGAFPGAIIVLHDSLLSGPAVREALHLAIPPLKQAGYSFAALPEHLVGF